MKYLTGALWKDINSDDKTIRTQAETKWKKNAALCEKRYDKEKALFPNAFIELYESMHGFHDFRVNKIAIEMEDWANRLCTVELVDGEALYELVFQKVSTFEVNCPSLHASFCNELRWGYSEIGHKGKRLTLSVLFDFDKEFTIEFKTVTVLNSVNENTGDGSLCSSTTD